jgi:hypothetical protein
MRKERRACVVLAQDAENLRRVYGVGAVIERERDDPLGDRDSEQAARRARGNARHEPPRRRPEHEGEDDQTGENGCEPHEWNAALLATLPDANDQYRTETREPAESLCADRRVAQPRAIEVARVSAQIPDTLLQRMNVADALVERLVKISGKLVVDAGSL